MYERVDVLHKENEHYQIVIIEKDKTIKLLNGNLEKKSIQLQKLMDENILITQSAGKINTFITFHSCSSRTI